MDPSLVADAVLDVELDEGRRLAPAKRIPFKGLMTLRRGRETVLSEAEQCATVALLELELDGRHRIGRLAPPKDEALRWQHLDHDAVPIGVNVLFGSPTAPAKRELSARAEVDLAAACPPPGVHRLGGRQRRPHLRARRADEHAVTDLGCWFAYSCSST